MKTIGRHGAVVLMLLILAGCGGSKPAPKSDFPPEDVHTRLGEKATIDVAEWLGKPRSELARLADDWTKTLGEQQKSARTDPGSVDLLPRTLPPVVIPIFQQAKYSTHAGFSLPEWLPEGKRDAGAALHLARFGDHEAAVKLADPNDRELAAQLQDLRCRKNYPLEWTRLVGLVLGSAQLRLAAGDADGATTLVRVHEQLRELLDPKAAAGALGSLLLPAGKRTLQLAAKVWRDPKRNKIGLAEDVEKALEEWGKVPPVAMGLRPQARAVEVSQALGVPVAGKGVAVARPADLARAIDILALPLPTEGIEAAATFFDAKEQLAQVQLAYRAKIDTTYPETTHLGYGLLERGFAEGKVEKTPTLQTQKFHGDGLQVEVVRTNRSNALGGLVNLRWDNGPRPALGDLRKVGPIDLDRGFERNRLGLVPHRTGEAITLRTRETLDRLTAGLGTPAAVSAVLRREKEADVVRSVQLTWAAGETNTALTQLLPGLWSALGWARLQVGDLEGAEGMLFTWRDDQTQAQLRLPFSDEAPVFTVEDVRPSGQLAKRIEVVQARDAADRRERWKTGKTELRLDRSPGGVNDFSLETLELGIHRLKAEALLPTGKAYRKSSVPEGLSLLVLTPPAKDAPYWARQVLLRFDRDNRLSEVRVRYEEMPIKGKRGSALLDRLSSGRAGQPETLPAPWAALWADVPAAASPIYRRWQDDRTVRTYQSDGGLSEVVLRDRPLEDREPTPWSFVRDGIVGCGIGVPKALVQTALGQPGGTSNGADVHRMPASSPYEMVVVWYQQERVSKFLAVHRGRVAPQEKDATAALQKVWTQNLDALGFIRRQQGRHDPVLASYCWNDDRVRVRTTVQLDDAGARTVTEWLGWRAAK